MKFISPYYSKSWFTDVGRAKILKDLMPRLPDVSGRLFITLTIDPKLFDSPEHAFEVSRDRIRRMMFSFRKGIEFEGKYHKIDSPYMVKVEFHRSGYAHFHIIFMTRRFIPGKLLNEVWGLGRTNIKRIQSEEFYYLLKYVTKDCDLPEWVKQRKRIRIIQTSKGFYRDDATEEDEPSIPRDESEDKRTSETIGERLLRWSKSAVITEHKSSGQIIRRVVNLSQRFWEILDEWLYEIALQGDYLGNGKSIFYRGSIFNKYVIYEYE